MRQDQALNLLKLGKNVFLTGAAGSGKTYLLNQYIEHLKSHHVNFSVTASTGIAATHLDGMTIHAWSGIGLRESWSEKDLEKLLSNSRIKRNYKKTKVLIVDEISMLHAFQLDMVDQAARFILGNDKPFGGIQIVLCGDFFQLPPVSTSRSGEKAKFSFQADIWQTAAIHVCYLSEQHRQSDNTLLTILNDIRTGTAGEHTKVPLRTRYKKEPENGAKATKLYARNINVDSINDNMLESLSGAETSYQMETQGFSALVDALKKSCLAQTELKLKIGAEVMFVKNDIKGSYVNGTRGIVTAFENDDLNTPVVKTYDDQYILAYPEEWKYEENGVIRAIIKQIPLRLAWAITIHKSQGMTLDAAEIDLGDTFEPGMGYVALSRVRSLSGLKLMNLNEMALKVHPKILQHDNDFKYQSAASIEILDALSETELNELQQHTIFHRFAGSSSQKTQPAKPKKAKKTPNHLLTLEMLKEKLPIDAIAKKFDFTFNTIIKHLEKLKGEQLVKNEDLDYLKSAFNSDDFTILHHEFQLSTDGKLTPIYEKFAGEFSFEQLKIVRLFVE